LPARPASSRGSFCAGQVAGASDSAFSTLNINIAARTFDGLSADATFPFLKFQYVVPDPGFLPLDSLARNLLK
jgi:hypothetical protein